MRSPTKILMSICLLLVVAVLAIYFFRTSIIKRAGTNSFTASILPAPEDPNASLDGVNIKTIAGNTNELRSWLGKVGPRRVMERLLENSGDGSLQGCHQEAHIVGKLAYELYGPAAFGGGTSQCHSGYYHGAMETMLYQEGTANLAGTIDRICVAFATQFGRFECLHGVGHGVMAYEDYDLPKALGDCEKLGSNYGRDSCYGGVFMENIAIAQGRGAAKDHTTTWVNKDPHYPCNAISKSASVQQHCYLVQTSWMLELLGNDFSLVSAECLKASLDVVPFCFASMGRDAAGLTLRDPRQIMGVCLNAPQERHYRDYCLVGGLNVIVDFWGSELKDQATVLCKLLPPENKPTCYTALRDKLKNIFADPANAKAVCAGFETEYRSLCTGF